MSDHARILELRAHLAACVEAIRVQALPNIAPLPPKTVLEAVVRESELALHRPEIVTVKGDQL